MFAPLCPLEVFRCKDCDYDTLRDEYYMVNNAVWRAAHKKRERQSGMLCIGCLERRLGRELTAQDFIDYPVNIIGHEFFKNTVRSHRLESRLYNAT